MSNLNLRRGVAVALAGTGVLHLALAPEYLSEQAYIGALFIAGGITSLVLAALMWVRDDARVWLGSALVALGMGAGFILSRTVGLPGFHESEWELSGLLSLLLEGAVVAGAVQALRGPSTAGLVSG